MNLSYGLFPGPVYWAADGLFGLAILAAVRGAPWGRLKRSSEELHVFLGGCVALLLIWHLRAGIHPGQSFHLLGGTLFALMFGWELALIGVSLVLVGTTLNGLGDWYSLPLNALLTGVLPVACGYGVYRLAVRFLPHHFFVYVIVNGFLCAALSMVLTVGASSLLMLCCGTHPEVGPMHDYLLLVPMMSFAEGFFTGMLITALVLFRPEWIATFDDRRYIAGK